VRETHEIEDVDLPPICAQPKGKPLSATMFKRSQITQIWSKRCIIGTVRRVISMHVQHTYSRVHTPTNEFSVNYLYFRIIPAMLSRSAKQHPSNSAHLMRRFVRGLSICIYQLFVPIDFRAQFPTRATRGAVVVGTSTYPCRRLVHMWYVATYVNYAFSVSR
jgi:hypothetical protein